MRQKCPQQISGVGRMEKGTEKEKTVEYGVKWLIHLRNEWSKMKFCVLDAILVD